MTLSAPDIVQAVEDRQPGISTCKRCEGETVTYHWYGKINAGCVGLPFTIGSDNNLLHQPIRQTVLCNTHHVDNIKILLGPNLNSSPHLFKSREQKGIEQGRKMEKPTAKECR